MQKSLLISGFGHFSILFVMIFYGWDLNTNIDPLPKPVKVSIISTSEFDAKLSAPPNLIVKKLAAEIQGKSYSYIIDEEYRWETWAAPKKEGEIDYNVAMTGDDLHDFVNRELFPYLGGFSQRATSPDTIAELFVLAAPPYKQSVPT